MPAPLFSNRIRAILLDIEGTTTPVDFVYKTLFPYASARVAAFLERHHGEDGVAGDLAALKQQRRLEAEQTEGLPPWREDSAAARIASAAAYVCWLIEHDRKLTPLKTLEGRIWEAGYRSGELRGDVYPDVAPAFARWRAQGRRIAIFSSGSVLAQNLLFGYSTAGDLTAFISAYFDTTTGPKKEPESYRRIAAALELPLPDILFLSDVMPELDAARGAGMGAALCVRPGHAGAPPGSPHPVVHTLHEVFP